MFLLAPGGLSAFYCWSCLSPRRQLSKRERELNRHSGSLSFLLATATPAIQWRREWAGLIHWASEFPPILKPRSRRYLLTNATASLNSRSWPSQAPMRSSRMLLVFFFVLSVGSRELG